MAPLSMMDRRGQEGARRRMTVVRHLLFSLLLLAGFIDLQAVAAHARERGVERAVVGCLAPAAMPIAPCRDGITTAVLEVAAPSELLPDLLPAEREGDAVADRPSNGTIGFPFESARGTPPDRDIEHKPAHGFSSRAPPVLS